MRDAAPVINAFPILLSGDTGSDYRSDLTRLSEATAAWSDAPAADDAAMTDAPSCPVRDHMTARNDGDELTETDCA